MPPNKKKETQKEYTKYDKKKLIDRISKIHNKNIHKNIKKIIEKNNPDLNSTKNANGIFIYFNDLNEKTYGTIKNYLDNYDKQESKKKENDSEFMSSDENSDESEEVKVAPIKKLKLTNAEQHILNQVKYKNTMNEIKEASESDIFLRKTVAKKVKK